jgi:predicted ester cyclase
MNSTTEANKAIVIRFNKEVIEEANHDTLRELVADDCVNHFAPPGAPAGVDGMGNFLFNQFHPAFPDMKVKIHVQVAEGDLVTTRKSIYGTHLGPFMGLPPTGKKVVIEVIDIIQLCNGKYTGHWAISNIPSVVAELSSK